jgi:superfamily I DNA and/or RNA helicase
MKSDLVKFASVSAFVEVSTVDAFQGREADVVILSCVRAPKPGHAGTLQRAASTGIGFLEDVRRMNVAITRARRSLWVLGHLKTLYQSRPWRKLAQHAAAENVLFQAVPKYSAVLRCDRAPSAELPQAVPGGTGIRRQGFKQLQT